SFDQRAELGVSGCSLRGSQPLAVEVMLQGGLIPKRLVDLGVGSPGEQKLPPVVREHVLCPGLGNRSINGDTAHGNLLGQERAPHSPHAMTEDENLIGIDVRIGLERLQRLAESVELGVEVNVAQGASFAVSAARLVDAQSDESTRTKSSMIAL